MRRIVSLSIEEAVRIISPVAEVQRKEYGRLYRQRHASELKVKRKLWKNLPLSEKRRIIEEKYTQEPKEGRGKVTIWERLRMLLFALPSIAVAGRVVDRISLKRGGK